MAHLLFLTGTPLEVRFGSGTAVGISVLKNALESAGHGVTVLCPPGADALSTLSRLRFDWRMRNAARRLRPDVVVAFDWDGVLLARAGIPHVASIKGVVADERRFENGGQRVVLTAQAWLERSHVRRADRIVATSVYSAEWIRRAYGPLSASIAVVPEPIALDRWMATLVRVAAPVEPKTAPTILCVAHLYPRKNVRTLLLALTRLPKPAVLRVVGTGPELSALKRLARELDLETRVVFTGHVPFEDLAAEYRNADVFCLPSRQEGFGIVFLEAMAAGLPIVAARAGAVPELVRDGECGVLVSPDDVEGLSRALERLLGNAPERRSLGETGKRRVGRYEAGRVSREFLHAIGLPASCESSAGPPTSR